MNDRQLLALRYDWESCDAVRAPELAATFARLEITCGRQLVTQVEDARSESIRRSIYVPLYPLAEWCAYNWWFLFWHSRPESLHRDTWGYESRRRHSGRQWLDHHNLRAVGDGFFWPDLTIVPDSGSFAVLAWRADLASQAGLRFTSSGEAEVTLEDLRSTLEGLIESVLTRLAEVGIKRSPLHEEWEDLRQLDEDEAAFCSAAARLGLDPSAVPEVVEESILQADSVLDDALLDDFLRAADPHLVPQDLRWVESSFELVKMTTDTPKRELPQVPVSTSRIPWERGWRTASALRNASDMTPTDPFEPESFLSLVTNSVEDRGMQGAGGLSATRRPVVVLGGQRPKGSQRFASARGLFRVLDGDGRFLITSAYGSAQKSERAFAAELLAPAGGLREQLGSDEGSADDVDVARLSEHFGVQDQVVIHQLKNHLGMVVR